MREEIRVGLELLRAAEPLVLFLTNYVTMEFVANGVLAVGGKPIMSESEEELRDLVGMSDVLVVNIGTLDDGFLRRARIACGVAKRLGKPVIFDPVGVGASTVRTQVGRELMAYADVIRGNASEIKGLWRDIQKSKGVEAVDDVGSVTEIARNLARKLGCTVVVSGEEDFVTDGQREKPLSYGSVMMKLVTGMGCTMTAVIAAFRGVISDSFEAAVLGTAYFGLCGNLAEKKGMMPGTFQVEFLDQLYRGDFEKILK